MVMLEMKEKPNSDKFVGLGRSDELIARAEKLVDEITLPVRTDIFDTEGNLANLVPELVAEIKQLREFIKAQSFEFVKANKATAGRISELEVNARQ